MTDLYWVGGSGTEDAAATTHWSTSNGGGAGAGPPTSSDDIHFTSSSGAAAVVTLSGALNCRNLICELGFTGRFAGSGTRSIAGNLTYLAGMATNTNSGTFTFTATDAGHTITSAGNRLPALTFNGVSGVWTLQDALDMQSGGNQGFVLTLTNGSFVGNGMAISCGAINAANANLRTLNLDGCAITTLGGNGTPLGLGTNTTGLTFSATGTTWTITRAGANLTMNLAGVAGLALGTSLTVRGGGPATLSFASGSFTLTGNMILKGPGQGAINFTVGQTFTMAGMTAPPDGVVIPLRSVTPGSAATLAKSGGGTVVLTGVTVKDLTATPAATWFAYGLPVATMNVSGNTGWTFSARRVLTSARAAALARTQAAARALAAARTSVG